MFNITNFAQFENIQFTGEDNLVTIFEQTEDNEAILTDVVQAAPFKFCDFESEPSGYLETAIANLTNGSTSSFNYTCQTGFNATLNAVVNQTDQSCVESFVTDPIGPRSCQGEPNRTDFFQKTPHNFYSRI